jgi:DNA (cytosine-5)-methyltransferase 1
MDAAIQTREANGFSTIYNDVWDGLENPDVVPDYDLLIASPPCQGYSLAGKGSGRKALDDVLGMIEAEAYKDHATLRNYAEHGVDDRDVLVLSPLAYIWRDKPSAVALEQVPAVLPVWQAYAEAMREWGYSVDVANLQAEQYGVPQTRKRAILVARLDGGESEGALLPTPTHSRYYPRTPDKLDSGVKKWVSMYEALSWGTVDQPSHTVTAGVHGPTDRWASGGNSVRKALDAKVGTEAWVPSGKAVTDKRTTYAERFDVEDVSAIQSFPKAVQA